MSRWILLVPLVLCGVLAWLLLGDNGGKTGRTTGPREWVNEQGDTVRILDGTGDHVRERSRREVPAVLTGVVFDPYGRPVDKAEVEVLHPKPYRLYFTSTDGRYKLEFKHPGEYVVQASLTIDLAPVRKTIVVPESGDPPSVDFRLKQAGPVFGEVIVGQRPATKGFVDIEVGDLFGDWQYEIEATIENGFFSFPREPPRDLPLRIRVISDDGFMKEPIYFRYTGEHVDLGRLALLRYPTLLMRMRLPDGSEAGEVYAGEAAELKPEQRYMARLVADGLPDDISSDSRVLIRERKDRSMRLVFWAGPRHEFRVVRDVELVRDQLREMEITMRPGPITIRRRLLGKGGDPIRARFQLAGGRPGNTGASGVVEESGVDGYFETTVPWSGIHTLHLRGLYLVGLGWIDLPPRAALSVGFTVDADAPATPCVLDLDGTILLVGRAGSPVALAPPKEPSAPRYGLGHDTRPGIFGVLIRPSKGLREMRWVRALKKRNRGAGEIWSDWAYPERGGTRFRITKNDLTIVDAR